MSPTQYVSYTAILGFVLRNARMAAGMNQVEIALQVGISQSGWAKIEKGVVPINVLQLHAFACWVGVSSGELLNRTDELVQKCKFNGQIVVMERVPPSNTATMVAGLALVGLLTALLFSQSEDS